MAKYKNKKAFVGGKEFDSKKEAKRYSGLLLLQRAGKISSLREQVKYVLIPAQYEEYERVSPKTGKKLNPGRRLLEKECSYIADFVYTDNATSKEVVEDTKGYRDPSSAGYAKFVIKRKLMLWIHGIKVKEV